MARGSRASHYPSLPFHGIRALSWVSALIVSGVLVYFCVQLRADGYKIPWTFLVMVSASLITVITLLSTSIMHCCFTLTPLFNLVLNSILLIIWTLGMGLLSWNMYGTLSHSCVRSNWASNDGIFICQVYKALFSFVVIGWIVQVALIVLDVRARRQQTTVGSYKNLDRSGDVKMDTLSRGGVNARSEPEPYGFDPDRINHTAPANPFSKARSTSKGGGGRGGPGGYYIPEQQTAYDPAPTRFEAYRPYGE